MSLQHTPSEATSSSTFLEDFCKNPSLTPRFVKVECLTVSMENRTRTQCPSSLTIHDRNLISLAYEPPMGEQIRPTEPPS